ncbi:unnamed protein product [Meloidogyne enterolobii]|uniref:Uncharacterized protein n=1 Tax=Meloidogyne enterolobii TaxID=390850 RepID=A0ACB1B5E3_MELEN
MEARLTIYTILTFFGQLLYLIYMVNWRYLNNFGNFLISDDSLLCGYPTSKFSYRPRFRRTNFLISF